MAKPKTVSVKYEQSHQIQPLKLVVIIVPEGQESAIIDILNGLEISVAFISRAKGTATSDFYDVMGIGESSKQVVISLVKESLWPQLKEKLAVRFSVSAWSKGIAFMTSLTALSGVSAYKMLTNTRFDEKPADNSIGKKELPQ